jgi:hypothetical protein
MPSDKEIVDAIIKRHGPVINLEKEPGVIIDIIRRFADDPDGGDQPCGGVPNPPSDAGGPTPPPSPSGSRINNPGTLDEVLRQLTQLRAEVNGIRQHLGVRQPGR